MLVFIFSVCHKGCVGIVFQLFMTHTLVCLFDSYSFVVYLIF